MHYFSYETNKESVNSILVLTKSKCGQALKMQPCEVYKFRV